MERDEFEFPRGFANAADAFLKGENELHPDLPVEISGESTLWLRAFLVDVLNKTKASRPFYQRLERGRGRRLDALLDTIDKTGEKVKVMGQSHPSLRFPEKVKFATDYNSIRMLGLCMLPHDEWNHHSILSQWGTKFLVYQAFLELEDAHSEAGGKPNPDLRRYFTGQMKDLAERYTE